MPYKSRVNTYGLQNILVSNETSHRLLGSIFATRNFQIKNRN